MTVRGKIIYPDEPLVDSDLRMTYEAKNPIKATKRSFDVIETLEEMDGARLTILAEELDLPNSTVHSHLSTLMERGYVIQEDETYRLSLQFLRLGEATRKIHKVYHAGRAEIDELAAETGEVASLLVEEEGRAVFLYSAEGDDAMPLNTSPGTHIHLHASAMGKAILAQLADDEVDAILEEQALPAYTQNTITDEEALREELMDIREGGIAVDDEERVRGSRSVAAPLRGESGKIIGSVAISGPVSRLSHDFLSTELAERLHDATNIIELKLAYS